MPETPIHKLRFPEGEDPAKLALYYQQLAEDVERELDDIAPSQIATAGAGDEGKLLIVQNTGAPAFKALSGDVTVDKDGKVTIGKGTVGTEELADLGVTTGKVNNKAITLVKLAEALGLTEGYYADASVTSRKAKLTAGVKAATEDLALTGSYQDVPGATLEITPAVAGNLLVVATFDLETGAGDNAAGTAQGTLRVDEEDQVATAFVSTTTPGTHAIRATCTQCYIVPLSAAAHTLKLRAKYVSGSGSCKKANTRFLYELVAS